jgi:SAM-dependent methyltransferase
MTDYLQHPVGLDTPGVAAVMDELSLWSARFGLLLLEQVPVQPNMQILDLGCGTGFPTFELAQLGGATCRVIGVDVWHDALARARAKHTSTSYRTPIWWPATVRACPSRRRPST